MAEQIPYGVVVSVINMLGSLAFREITKICGVDREIERLKETVEAINAVLADADQKQQNDQLIQLWIRRLKKVLFKADDLLDELHTEHLLRKRDGEGEGEGMVRNIFSFPNEIVFSLNVAHDIEEIRDQFNAVAEDMYKYNLDRRVVVMSHDESNWRETSSLVCQDDIIGREGSKGEVSDLLLKTNGNQKLSSIAIVGVGGLGKTALAQLVFNDVRVNEFFNKKIWVCVSDDFDVRTIFKKMLKSLTGKEEDGQLLELLQKKIQENLNGQRYLLVLDDVWNQDREKWLNLKKYLMCGGEGSKILVTTRDQMVARCMGVKAPFALKGLTNDQSWDLFKRLAFGEDTIMTQKIELIGQKIADKCKGIPLLIRAMGSLFYMKIDEIDWEDILEGDFWKLLQSDHSIIPRILKLSYDHLSVELRQCFAYCSLYPKDWRYNKNELIQLWMAQGYIESQNERQSLEDVGEQYVHILLMRSFFQDVEMDEVNGIKYFKMHDLMHDLSQSVAGSDCIFFEAGRKIGPSPLHVNFAYNLSSSLDSLDASRLRSILGVRGLLKNNSSSFLKFKCLRSLSLSGWYMELLPVSIGEMKHLRYLDLSECRQLASLPKSVSNLVNLQTLKLKGCVALEFSLDVVTKLINLHHLHIGDYQWSLNINCKAFNDGMPIGLGRLTSLQSLSHFIVANDDKERKNAQLNELKELNLRNELIIENLELVRDVEEETKDVNLKAKKKLNSLGLNWGIERGVKNSDSLQLLENLCPHPNLKQLQVARYPGVKFSSWLPSLTNLVELFIFGCENCQFLPPLEGLVYLKTLHLQSMDALEYISYEGCSSSMAPHTTNFFLSLKTLVLQFCKSLKGWQRAGDANNGIDDTPHSLLPIFPCLSNLTIESCPNLSCMPTFPNLVGRLILRSCSMKPLIDTVKLSTTQELHSSLSMLESLHIDHNIEGLPEECMQNLTSLKTLYIWRLSSIVTLFRHMRCLPAKLEDFTISRIDNLNPPSSDEDFGIQFAALHCLHSLQNFSIFWCENVKVVPTWICNLRSLRSLHIDGCPSLESLPEGMHRLTNLQSLRVNATTLFVERCERGSGAEWHKIAHIPNILVNGRQI